MNDKTTYQPIVIEYFGEGKTDIGNLQSTPSPASEGVLPILTSKICGKEPQDVLVRRMPYMFAIGKSRAQKVALAKRQAFYNGSSACVFVIDTEGENYLKLVTELVAGRDQAHSNYPMVVGAAHTCIEAWLLADATALKRGLDLTSRPTTPDCPENLPAPRDDEKNNPKEVIKKINNNKELKLKNKSAVALWIDLETLAAKCPSFAAFAAEVQQHILPLFPTPSHNETTNPDISP